MSSCVRTRGWEVLPLRPVGLFKSTCELMIHALFEETGSPVIQEIVTTRNSSWRHLLVALCATTTAVLLWVAYTLAASSPDRDVASPQFLQTIAYDDLPVLEPYPPRSKSDPAEEKQEELSADSGADIEPNEHLHLEPPRLLVNYSLASGILQEDTTREKEIITETDTVTLKRIHVLVGYKSATMKEVLHDIGSRTGLLFTFSDNLVANTPDITLNEKDWTAHELLSEILNPRGLQYAKMRGSMVAVFKPL
jgi:hypothetical protein